MSLSDLAKALGVGVAVLVLTIAASFPMVAVYAYLIEPGHSEAFYTEAAQWIAPWSSHVLGPILFFAFNYWLTRRKPERNAMLFAASTIVLYLVVDFGLLLPLMGVPIADSLSLTVAVSLLAKVAGSFLGAYAGERQNVSAAGAS